MYRSVEIIFDSIAAVLILRLQQEKNTVDVCATVASTHRLKGITKIHYSLSFPPPSEIPCPPSLALPHPTQPAHRQARNPRKQRPIQHLRSLELRPALPPPRTRLVPIAQRVMCERALELRQVLVRVEDRALQHGQPRIRRELLARSCQPVRASRPSRKARAGIEEPECSFARCRLWAGDDEARAGFRVEGFK